MNNNNNTRREFLSKVGLSAAAFTAINANIESLHAATDATSSIDPKALARDESHWRGIQHSFDNTRSIINLNNAGICHCPTVVTNAVKDIIDQTEKLPPYEIFNIHPGKLDSVRRGLARLFDCDMEELSLVRNATEAMASILMGIPLNRGDEILTTRHDYWAMLDCLNQRRRRDGIEFKMVDVPIAPKTEDELVEIFERGITPNTKLILVSHPVNLTGQFFPIKKICDMAHARGIEVAVDAAQSFAQIEYTLDDLGCDYMATSLHKWLMAPKGTGMLYVKREKIEKLWPALPAHEEFDNNIRKFEQMGTVGGYMLATNTALAFHNSIGSKQKEERLRRLTHYWVDNVKNEPNIRFNTSFEDNMSCAIANFYIEGIDNVALTKYLFEKHNIYTVPINREIPRGTEGVRVSPSLQNTLNELDIFSEIIVHVARKGLLP